jgi:AcrR family transcriptional regulator
VATTTERKTAEQRREEIVEAAFVEFAQKGLHGTSTDAIARRAGVSQPYLFRLFGTKKDLFIAAVNRCFRVTLETFMRAAEGKRGEEALDAIARAYAGLLQDREKLLMQMQGHVACDDPEICEVVRRGFGDIVEYVERVSGAGPERVRDFMAMGMLLNVISAMDLLHDEQSWAKRLHGACRYLE